MGLRCSVCSKKKGSETKARPCAANEATEVMADSANSGRRSRSTGSMGAGWPAWWRSKAPNKATASNSAGSTMAAGSRCAAAARAKISAAKPPAVSKAAQASKPAPRGALCGNVGQASAKASRPSGTFIQNNQGQLATDSTSDATVGPAANATPTVSAFRPMPRPSCCGGKYSRTSAMFTLISAPAPTPFTARATANWPRLPASAQANDATVNTTNPAMNTRLGPKRSPSAAHGSRLATTAS